MLSKFDAGVTYRCVNDEEAGICGEYLDVVDPGEMNKMPHRHIGAILCFGPAQTIQYGTGTLISRDLVLTCAHVIYNKEHQAYYPKIYFYPGLSGKPER